MNVRLRNRKGTTLLGTLILTIVIVCVIASTMVNMVSGRQHVRMSHHRLEAAHTFFTLVQGLRSTPFSQLVNGPTDASLLIPELPKGFLVDEVVLSEIVIPEVPAMKFKSALITLSYLDPNGKRRKETREFIIRGPANRGYS